MTHSFDTPSGGDKRTSGPVSTSKGKFEQLTEHELWWRDKSDFLLSHGYLLRPRFRPGWVPSWHGTGENPLHFEDSRFHMIEKIMDATRLSDGRRIALKSVEYSSSEMKLVRILSSEEALKDPMNHCVPVLDYIGDWRTPGSTFIAMPLLYGFDEPEFARVSEVMDFIKQTLEGLVYIHRLRVAHRDLSGPNIMMDGDALYPDGSHPDPSWRYLLPDKYNMARTLIRSEVGKVTYYFVDFGISSHFDDPVEPQLVTGIDGLDEAVPERSLTKPYDPFAVDIFTLGNTYRKAFSKYSNLDFLAPLMEEMTEIDPAERPTAREALDLFLEINDELSSAALSKRLRPVNEPIIVHYVREISVCWSSISRLARDVFSPLNILYVTIPVGVSVLILFRGHHRLLDKVRALFTQFTRSEV